MSKIEVNAVEPQCGTTLTLGASGDTVTLGSGASQSGFGRTGTVDWQTTKKTASFTAANGEGYFVDTTSSAITMTLPASPSAGDIVAFKDYASTFNTNNFTIGRNGSNLDGNAGDRVVTTANTSMSLVYVDSTQGWKSVEEGTGFIGEGFLIATGGDSILTCGDFKTHVFTGPGTFTVTGLASCSPNNVVDYIVVAGGGGGGTNTSAGGGGAGGFRLSNSVGSIPAPTMSPLANPTGLTVSAQSYPITVGGGGTAVAPSSGTLSSSGSDSIFSSITSAGGGGGVNSPNRVGVNGGSGSGGKGAPAFPGPGFAGGSGNTPPVSPSQGNNGGRGYDGISSNTQSGGGGGAGAVGGDASSGNGGTGGAGSFLANAFIGPTSSSYGTPGPVGSTRYFSGGGGGATDSPNSNTYAGGAGGGGKGGNPGTPITERSGGTNTGGGAGAGGANNGNGGSGIVMIRYKFQ